MKRIHFTAVLGLVASLSASAAWAQGVGQPPGNDVQQRRSMWETKTLLEQMTWKLAASEGLEGESRIAEDIEVLASIVRDNLNVAYADAARESRDPHWHSADAIFHHANVADPNGNAEQCGEPLADYIPGHGIVVQMRIPAPQAKPATTADSGSKTEPPSQWERTRRHLRGESDSFFAAQCQKCHERSFVDAHGSTGSAALWNYYHTFTEEGDGGTMAPNRPTTSALLHTLLETLAENGHNVRDLKPHERITISLSYSDAEQSPRQKQKSTEDKKETEKPNVDPNQQKPAETGAKESQASPTVKQPLSETQRYALEKWLTGGTAKPTDDNYQSVRRIYLDLLGRLPTPQEATDAAGDSSQGSYEMLVERLLRPDEAAVHREAWMESLLSRGVRRKNSFPNRARISVSVTKEQLDKVAANELTPLELMRQSQIHLFEPKN